MSWWHRRLILCPSSLKNNLFSFGEFYLDSSNPPLIFPDMFSIGMVARFYLFNRFIFLRFIISNKHDNFVLIIIFSMLFLSITFVFVIILKSLFWNTLIFLLKLAFQAIASIPYATTGYKKVSIMFFLLFNDTLSDAITSLFLEKANQPREILSVTAFSWFPFDAMEIWLDYIENI